MTKTFNVGISGAGTIGHIHAKALRSIDTANIVAIAEPRLEAGDAFAREYGGTHYTSFVDMLDHDDLDIVIVTAPSGIHPDQVVLAAEAGKHVITEKPMAITTDGLDRMINATECAGVQFAVIFQNRLSTDVLTVKRALERGVFGTPILANGAMYWHRTQEYYDANGGWRGTWALDGGGAMMNQAIHALDLLQWLMGGIASVAAHTATLSHTIETEDTASASFRFRNGALGSITATTSASTDWPTRIEIVGTEGRVTLENNVVTLWDAKMGKDGIHLTGEDLAITNGWAPNEPFGRAHERQLRLILSAIAERRPPYVPGREAREAVDSILSLYDAARNGTTQERDGSSGDLER